MNALSTLWRHAIDVLLPAHCVGCGLEGTYLCDGCLRAGVQAPPQGGVFAFDEATVPFAYEGVPRTAVHQLKYARLRAIAPAMAKPMADVIAARGVRAGVVVPVPLHRQRLRQRGFNQSALLARGVGEILRIPVGESLLERPHLGVPQVEVRGREERRRNVKGAFGLAPGARVAGLDLVLVDDVLTTGSTMDSAAGVLKGAGARSVHALAFAGER